MAQIIAAEIVVYDPSLSGGAGGTKTLYYATQGYVTAPSDTPANTFYEGRIKQPANTSRRCFAGGATSGRTQIGFGELVLVNNDGGLDSLLNYSFAGRNILIKLGEVKANSAGVATWTTLINGTMEQAELSWSTVIIRVRDRQQDVAKPHQSVKYGGTNSLPNGIDGVAGDLAGMPKPKVYGQVFNLSLPCVNTARQIYQAHDGSALQSVDGVYDRGAPLTAGSVASSQSDLETTAPSAGQYRVWNSAAGCYIRLGSAPGGTVTADLTQGAATANRTAAQLFKQVLLDAGVSSGNISSSDITALDALAPYACGYALNHYATNSTLEILDAIANSVGAYFAPDATGVWRIAQMSLPAASPIGLINATDVIAIDRIASVDAGVGIPSYKVRLNYKKNLTVQNDLTSAVTLARKGLIEQQWRTIEVTDASVLTANATSPVIEFDSYLVSATDATAEANRRLTLYKTRRDFYRVKIRIDKALASVIDLGKCITLQLNRFAMSSGKNFLIIGITTDMRGYLFELTLWG